MQPTIVEGLLADVDGVRPGQILIEEGLKFVNACPVPEKLQ